MAPVSAGADDRLVVAVTSRALFDLQEADALFDREGVEAYRDYQIAHEEAPLAPGAAYPMVRKLLALNNDGGDHPGVEVVLISRNSADTGLRIFNSIRHHGLGIDRAAFTGGEKPYRYITSFGADLFLSVHGEDVRNALDAGVAAATILPSGTGNEDDETLRIAFDGDAVLFSDAAERVYRKEGLAAFDASETAAARVPLEGGPFRGFLAKLNRLQRGYPASASPIRTALVTARGAPSHERVIRTLRAWQIHIDEALFLRGLDKGEFLRDFRADIFFDDQLAHCDAAREHVASGHVPHGVANEPEGK